MAKKLTVNPQKCVACHTCELVCSFSHFEESNPKNSCVRVVEFDDEGLFFPMICYQCEDAWCLRHAPPVRSSGMRKRSAGGIERSMRRMQNVHIGVPIRFDPQDECRSHVIQVRLVHGRSGMRKALSHRGPEIRES